MKLNKEQKKIVKILSKEISIMSYKILVDLGYFNSIHQYILNDFVKVKDFIVLINFLESQKMIELEKIGDIIIDTENEMNLIRNNKESVSVFNRNLHNLFSKDSELRKLYNSKIKVNFLLFDFIKNKYKIQEELNRINTIKTSLYASLITIIITAIISFIFIKFFTSSINIEKIPIIEIKNYEI